MNTMWSRSTGSMKNAVEYIPPQKYSPALPGTSVRAGSSVIAKPRPKPVPALPASLNSDCETAARSAPPGSWLRVIRASVLGLTIRTPSSAPWPISIRQNRS